MRILTTVLADAFAFEPCAFQADRRGYYLQTYDEASLRAVGLRERFVHEGHSIATRAQLSGLFYQVRRPHAALLFANEGTVFAVGVDLRRGSRSFAGWGGVELSAENRRALWLPEGFAYGFLVLSARARVVNLYTEFLYPRHDRILAWDDPELAIRWPRIQPITPLFQGTLLHAAETFE